MQGEALPPDYVLLFSTPAFFSKRGGIYAYDRESSLLRKGPIPMYKLRNESTAENEEFDKAREGKEGNGSGDNE